MLNNKLENIVSSFIGDNKLLNKQATCLVALSGGADSVALLLCLLRLEYKVEAVHCNFHLRGEESDRDEAFCRQLCQDNDVPLHLVHFDTNEYAQLHKVSIEMAARNLRYAYFERLRRDINAQAVCVAHHRDDSVETLLLNLVRGTGLSGLTGIAARNGYVVRPLLCVSRQDIEAWLAGQGQAYVTDSTNLVDDVVRNKLRLNVIPMLEQINPSVKRSIAQTAQRLAEAEAVVDDALLKSATEVCHRDGDAVVIDIPKLMSQPSPHYTFYNILKPFGFSAAQTDMIFTHISAPTGRRFEAGDKVLFFDRGNIVIMPLLEKVKPMRIPDTGLYALPSGGHLRVKSVECDNGFVLPRASNVVALDASRLSFPLTVRPVSEGDRFVPFGMRGSKLLSDFMTDLKLSYAERQGLLVVTSSSGDIAWVVGRRPDNRFRITTNTANAIVLTFEEQ